MPTREGLNPRDWNSPALPANVRLRCYECHRVVGRYKASEDAVRWNSCVEDIEYAPFHPECWLIWHARLTAENERVAAQFFAPGEPSHAH